ncbi:hypothetical protein ACS0TY_033404 [Phlomoides rotata]
MQREISLSSHGNPVVSAESLPFTGDYDFPSIFTPKHSSPADYLYDGSSNYTSSGSQDALALSVPQFQQQQLHQDLMDRYRRVLAHLRDVAKQAQTLRQENINLKMANIDLNNRLNLLLSKTMFHGGADLGPSLDSLMDGMRRLGMGVEEEGTSENDAIEKSPTSVMDSGMGGGIGAGRVQLPKSISVRSTGYLKAIRAGGSSARGGDFVKALKENNETQRVYVKGDMKEQPLELEVYNQGMLKTELCNKWQQTGTCPYGDNCQFAHGVEELRPVLRHPRYKTEVCRMVLNGVPCPYGHRCHFRHSLTDQEQLTRAMNSKSLEPINYR